MTKNNVYRDGKVHVMARKCSTCIYRPGNLMRLEPGRVEAMESESVEAEGVIVCHKTLGGDNAVCRGYFDVAKHRVGTLSVAERLGRMEEVPDA